MGAEHGDRMCGTACICGHGHPGTTGGVGGGWGQRDPLSVDRPRGHPTAAAAESPGRGPTCLAAPSTPGTPRCQPNGPPSASQGPRRQERRERGQHLMMPAPHCPLCGIGSVELFSRSARDERDARRSCAPPLPCRQVSCPPPRCGRPRDRLPWRAVLRPGVYRSRCRCR